MSEKNLMPHVDNVMFIENVDETEIEEMNKLTFSHFAKFMSERNIFIMAMVAIISSQLNEVIINIIDEMFIGGLNIFRDPDEQLVTMTQVNELYYPIGSFKIRVGKLCALFCKLLIGSYMLYVFWCYVGDTDGSKSKNKKIKKDE